MMNTNELLTNIDNFAKKIRNNVKLAKEQRYLILCPECRQPMNITWTRTEVAAECMDIGNRHKKYTITRGSDYYSDWVLLQKTIRPD